MFHGFMIYDVSGGHVLSHVVVFDLEHPRRKSESTSYLTQLNKTKANCYFFKGRFPLQPYRSET